MKPKFVVLAAILFVLPVVALAQSQASNKAASKYVGFTYKGVNPESTLPNGVKHLGGGLIGDFDADPVSGISKVLKGTTTMLWLETSTGRNESGVTGWRVLDSLSFGPLRSTEHLAFAMDPAIACTLNGKDLREDLVIVGEVSRKLGIFTPKRAWIANITNGKFEPVKTTGFRCTYNEP